MTFCHRTRTLKCIWNHEGLKIAKAILKINKARGITLLDIRQYYKDSQINGTEESPERNPHPPVNEPSTNEAEYTKKKSLFSIGKAGQIDVSE